MMGGSGMIGGSGMMGGWGIGGLESFGIGSLFVILFWVFVVAGLIWLVLALARRPTEGALSPRSSSAAALLDERLARGEIDLDEYKAREVAIGGTR